MDEYIRKPEMAKKISTPDHREIELTVPEYHSGTGITDR